MDGEPRLPMLQASLRKLRAMPSRVRSCNGAVRCERQVNPFRELVLKHPGARICVIGGAPGVEKDLKKVAADIYISANEHGLKLRECDYILAMDQWHKREQRYMVPYLRDLSDAPIISPWRADYLLTGWPLQPENMYSGLVAIWAAWAMGGWPVVVAGITDYNGEARAVRQAQAVHDAVFGPVRAVSGPLTRLFGKYRRRERFGPFEAHESLEALKHGEGLITVEVIKPITAQGIEWPAGSKLEVARHEVRLQLKHKMVREADGTD